jgi:DNA polymerase III alpha subunit
MDDNSIIFGLSAINGIGSSIADAIIQTRDIDKPYENMYDFFRRCDPVILKKTTIEHLAYSGAFDELVRSESHDIGRLEELRILEKEKEELGIYVTNHPVMGIWDILSKKVSCEIVELEDMQSGQSVKVGGIITSCKKIMTKKGQKMYKLILEDISAEIEIIVFPNSAKSIPEEDLVQGSSIIVSATLTKDGDEENATSKLILNSYEKLDSQIFSSGKSILFSIDRNISDEILDKIYDIIDEAKGDHPVLIEFKDDYHKYIYKFNIKGTKKVEPLIQQLLNME